MALKLSKGVGLLLLAAALLNLRLSELQALVQRLMEWLPVNPAVPPAAGLVSRLDGLNDGDVGLAAGLLLLFGVIALVEGVGLSRRVSWAGWMAICRSAVFIPFVLHRLLMGFNPFLMMVLAANSFIVWYLVHNRTRLFPARRFADDGSPVGRPSENLS